MSPIKSSRFLTFGFALLLLTPAVSLAEADLTCTITAEPLPDGQVTLVVNITNDGDSEAINTDILDLGGTVYLHLDGAPGDLDFPTDQILLETLGAGATTKAYEQTLTSLGPGPYTAWCWVNPLNTFNESNLDNNKSSVGYEIPEPLEDDPDLLVTAISASLKDGTENTYEFTVTVKNEGTLGSPTFSVDVFPGFTDEPDYLVEEAPVFCDYLVELAPAAEAEITCDGTFDFPEPGPQPVWAYVDLGGLVPEQNEENNVLFSPVVVKGPPDVTISAFSVTPAEGANTVAYQVTVHNQGGADAEDLEVCLYFDAAEEPAIGTPPDLIKVLTLTSDESVPVDFLQEAAVDGAYVAWAVVDCKGALTELDETNNTASQAYSVEGVPNEPPVLGEVTGPEVCNETALCTWSFAVTDEAPDTLKWTILDGPLGMWAASDGEIQYVPPLGSTATVVTATVQATDKGKKGDVAQLTFSIHPPAQKFEGIVGALGTMPKGADKSACAMVEVPGSGFGYVRTDSSTIRFFLSPTASTDAQAPVLVQKDLPILEPLLSCHVQALPRGGFAVLELTTQTLLVYGNDGSYQKQIDIEAMSGGGFLSEQFILLEAEPCCNEGQCSVSSELACSEAGGTPGADHDPCDACGEGTSCVSGGACVPACDTCECVMAACGQPIGLGPALCPVVSAEDSCGVSLLESYNAEGCNFNCGNLPAGWAPFLCKDPESGANQCAGFENPDVDAALEDGLCACLELEACVPDCDGKSCGDDGCGGICGLCAAAPGATLAFLDVGDSKRVIFVDVHSGKLDTSWGGNDEGTPGGGTPGILELHDPDAGGIFPHETYLWSDSQVVRVYNRYFASKALLDFQKDGALVKTTYLDAVMPPDPDTSVQPPWILLAAKDGGVQLVDYTTASLQWYDRDLSPVDQFTLGDPALPPGTPPAPGWVFLQAYGLSINNITCAVLGDGGFTCHDSGEERGFVIDAFGGFWENCPQLDVSPKVLNFGGVPFGEQKSLTLYVSNTGGGVLEIDDVTVAATGGELDAFNTAGITDDDGLLFPGETTTVEVSFKPKNFGINDATLKFVSNACAGLSAKLAGYSGPHFEVTPNPVSFFGVPLGEHSQTVTITSVGSHPLDLTSVKLSDAGVNFKLVPATVPPATLDPGKSVSFDVVFNAFKQGEQVSDLKIEFANHPVVSELVVPINGSTAGRLRATPVGFNFGQVGLGSTTTRTVTLSNTGATTVTIKPPKLTGPPGLTLDTEDFNPVLEQGQATQLHLTYVPSVKGTAVAVIELEHDIPNVPTYVLTAVAGTGTEFPNGFDGNMPLSAPDGPFQGPVGPDRAVIELSTGGFAVYGATSGAIHVINGAGEGDPWFGIGGVIQLTGPGGVFPEATGLGGSLIEMIGGGFALLSPDPPTLYAVAPTGDPNPFVGDGGVIDLDSSFPSLGAVGQTLVQLSTETFAAIDPSNDRIVQFRVDGAPDASSATSGIINFSGTTPDAGGGLITGAGDSLASTSADGFLFGDTATQKIWVLTSAGSAKFESTDGLLPTLVGPLVASGDNAYLQWDMLTGTVTRIDVLEPVITIDESFGDAGALDLSAVWPDAGGLGGMVIPLASGAAIGVAEPDADRLLFSTPTGEPYVVAPELTANLPSKLDFGVVAVGQVSAPKSLTLENTGTFELVVTFAFSPVQFHLEAGGVTLVIAPGETVTPNIVFEPSFPDTYTGELVITSTDPDLPSVATITLAGSTGSHIIVTPPGPVIDFGNVAVGDTVQKAIVVSNDGADAVLVSDITLHSDVPPTPPGKSFFVSQPIPGGTQVLNGEQKVLIVDFSPATSGVHSDWITIAHTDETQPPITLVLNGNSGGQIKVTPASLDCAGITLGNVTSCGTVTIANVGTGPLSIAGLSTTGAGFGVESVTAVIPAGGAPIVLPVTFTALQSGLTTGELVVAHNDFSVGGKTSVPLSADVPGAVWLEPANLDFGPVPVGGKVTMKVTVHTDGTAGAVQLLGASASGHEALSVTSLPDLPADLEPDAPITITISCSPKKPLHIEDGKLVVSTDSPGLGALTANVTCVAGSVLVASPGALDFGAVAGNESKTMAVTVTNLGLATATLTGASVDGDSEFDVLPLSTPTLAPGASTAVFVTFSPAAESHEAILKITQDEPLLGVLEVPLSGFTGKKLVLIGASDPVDLGVIGIGGVAEATVLAMNVGSIPLTLDSVSVVVPAGPFAAVGSPVEPVVLAPGQSWPVTVSFSPISIGKYSAQLQATTEEKADAVVGLVGKAGGVLSVTPTQLAFGEGVVDSVQTLPLQVANLSHAEPVTVKFFQGGDADAFTVLGLDPAGVTIPPNTVLSGVSVQFSPKKLGDFTSKLTFFSDKGVEGGKSGDPGFEGTSIDVVLQGKSGAAARVIYPATAFHGFADVQVGTTESRPVRVAAAGTASIQVLGAKILGAPEVFSLAGLGEPPVVIPPGHVKDLAVTCTPPEHGAWSGTVQILTDDPVAPIVPVKVWCSTPPRAIVSPRQLDFGVLAALDSATQTVTVENKGATVLVVHSVSLQAGGAEGAFELVGAPSLDTGLPVGGSLTFDVVFVPPDAQSYSATLSIETSDPLHGTIEIPISGFSGPRLELSQRVLNYCSGTGARTVDVSNSGTEALTLETDAGFVGVTDADLSISWVKDGAGVALPITLEPGELAQLVVDFSGAIVAPPGSPQGTQKVASAEFVIPSTDPSSPETTLQIVTGKGLAFDTGFTGVSDIGPPGDEVFSQASGLGAGLAELCTGGYVVSGKQPLNLYFIYPDSAGGATVLPAWGKDLGLQSLSQLLNDVGLPVALTEDFGGILAVMPNGDVIVGSSSAGAYAVLDSGGSLREGVGQHGLLFIEAITGLRGAGGDVDRFGEGGYVIADSANRHLIGVTASGALDPDFGFDGIANIGKIWTDAGDTVGESIVVLDEDSIALTDGVNGAIYVVKSNGLPDLDYGAEGKIALAGQALLSPGPFGLGGGLTAGSGVLTASDAATGRVITVFDNGTPQLLVQVNGATGVFNTAGALGTALAATDVLSSGTTGGKSVLVDAANGDLLFVDADGSAFSKGLPGAKVTPCPIVIANASLDGPAPAMPVTVENIGDTFLNLGSAEVPALTISTDAVSCGGGGDFPCEGTAQIPANLSSTVALTWDPAGKPGCFSETVTISHDGVNGPTVVCPLELGTTFKPEITPGGDLPSPSYEFPAQAVGTGFEKEFIVRNTGCEDMVVDSINISASPHFVLNDGLTADQEFPLTLGPGAIHKFYLTCAPQADGVWTNIVQLPIGTGTESVSITCVTGPQLTVTPEKLTWQGIGLGSALIKTSVFKSVGGAPAVFDSDNVAELVPTLVKVCPSDPAVGTECVTPATLDDLDPAVVADILAAFSVVPGPFSKTLPVGESQSISVKFGPQVSGSYEFELTIPSEKNPVTLQLVGASSPDVLFEPAPVDFGYVAEGETGSITVTICNTGADMLTLDPAADSVAETPFGLEPFAGQVVSAGQCIEVEATCAPTTAGVFEASLAFESNAASAVDENVLLDLTCRSGPGCMDVDPLLLDWGKLAWTSEPSAKSTKVCNNGTGPLDITAQIISPEGASQFTIVDPPQSHEIAAGSCIDIDVTFTPSQSSVELAKALLSLTTDSALEGCPTTVDVVLKAVVVQPPDEGEDLGAPEDDGDHGGTGDEDVPTVVEGSGGDVGSVDSDGGGEGEPDCGCDMTPGAPMGFPVGPVLFLIVMLLGFQALRRR